VKPHTASRAAERRTEQHSRKAACSHSFSPELRGSPETGKRSCLLRAALLLLPAALRGPAATHQGGPAPTGQPASLQGLLSQFVLKKENYRWVFLLSFKH